MKTARTLTEERTAVLGGVESFVLVQHIRYDYTAPVADLRQRLVVVPPAAHGAQIRHRWSIDVDGARPSRRSVGTDSFGNHVVALTVPEVTSRIEFRVEAELVVGPGTDAVRPDRRYLASTTLTAPTGALGEIGLDLEPGCDPGAVADLVHSRFTYDGDATGVRTTAAEAFDLGRGVCQDYAHVMLALCRQAGLPARYVSGHLVGEGGSHAWVEVLRSDPDRPGAWTVEAWDPTHNRRCHGGYLTVAVGRDYADVAPMSGTFKGRGSRGHLTVRKQLTRTTTP